MAEIFSNEAYEIVSHKNPLLKKALDEMRSHGLIKIIGLDDPAVKR